MARGIALFEEHGTIVKVRGIILDYSQISMSALLGVYHVGCSILLYTLFVLPYTSFCIFWIRISDPKSLCAIRTDW